jgi:hypothetical protein
MNGMKQKFLILLMMAFGLVACVLDDESETKWKPKNETWTVIIEPEYVMGYSSWGAYSSIGVQMDAFNEKGERIGRFYSGEIKGFTFEEGYRYKLRIEATTTDPGIMDGPAYDFQLIEVISKEYIGISKEGRREVTMDVQMVLMLTPDPTSSRGFYFLSGKSVDGGETLDMGMQEIYGAKSEMFCKYGWCTDEIHRYICRMRLSITPSDEPVFAKHNYRIRLEELISQREIADDSCAVATSKEEYESKEKALYF